MQPHTTHEHRTIAPALRSSPRLKPTPVTPQPHSATFSSTAMPPPHSPSVPRKREKLQQPPGLTANTPVKKRKLPSDHSSHSQKNFHLPRLCASLNSPNQHDRNFSSPFFPNTPVYQNYPIHPFSISHHQQHIPSTCKPFQTTQLSLLRSKNHAPSYTKCMRITHLTDDVLVKIIQHVLQMNPNRPSEISRRVCQRFRTTGQSIAMLSNRFNYLLRRTISSIELRPNTSHRWLKSMLVFTKTTLHTLCIFVDGLQRASDICLILATTAPPLRKLSISSLQGAPFEHVVAMLRALPQLRECEIQNPRPVDLAAIAHSCHSLQSLTLGAVRQYKEVDEIRRQIVSVIMSPVGRRLKALNLKWCCSTVEAFRQIARCCVNLERLSVEFGAMYWIRHRAFKAKEPLRVDLAACANEQRMLFRNMLKAASSLHLQSFSMSTLDVIPSTDLDLIFRSLSGLKELDISFGSAVDPPRCPPRSFNILTRNLGKTLKSIDVIGLSFTPQQVHQFATSFPELNSLSIWMSRNERPPQGVFKMFGKRIKHLSLLCDWNEPMCTAVGEHNTNLESLFLIAREFSVTSVEALIRGKSCKLKEFSLFINRKSGSDDGHVWNRGSGDDDSEGPSDRVEINFVVQTTARMVAKDCAAHLEKLNVSAASSSEQYFMDCSGIARELGRKAPHLWQICDSVLND